MQKLDSPYSKDQIEKILYHYDPYGMDVLIDDPLDPDFAIHGRLFPYDGNRTLTVGQAERAMRYITACVAKYPFNIRRMLAADLWHTYCQKWDDTGDERRSMRAI